MPTCSAVEAPIEWPTTCALSILSASMTAMTSSRNTSCVYLSRVFRHVGRRVAALAVGDAAVRAGEVPHLRLPGAVVRRIFMDEHHRRAAAGFLDVEFRSVGRGDLRHMGFAVIGRTMMDAAEASQLVSAGQAASNSIIGCASAGSAGATRPRRRHRPAVKFGSLMCAFGKRASSRVIAMVIVVRPRMLPMQWCGPAPNDRMRFGLRWMSKRNGSGKASGS